jgi:hypothetical protein
VSCSDLDSTCPDHPKSTKAIACREAASFNYNSPELGLVRFAVTKAAKAWLVSLPL